MEIEAGLSVRILFSGACRGNFNKFLKRVEKVHNKNGPFDVLFCVGSFFSESGKERLLTLITSELNVSLLVGSQEGSNCTNEEFVHFIDSKKKMPMTTYILGAYGNKTTKERLKSSDCNIQLLSKSGIVKPIEIEGFSLSCSWICRMA